MSLAAAWDSSPHTGARDWENGDSKHKAVGPLLFARGDRQAALVQLLKHMRPSETAAVPSTMPGFVRHENGPITPLERFAMDRSSSSFHALAGAAGGFTSGVVTCPLDVIKTKLQAQGAFRAQQTSGPARVVYSGMLGTARMIWREDGLKGMYRGLGPLIFGYLPTWAVWFPVYSASKEYLSTYNGNYGSGSVSCGRLANILLRRQSESCQCSFFSGGRSLFFDGHKSNMGHKDSPDVTMEQGSGS